MDDSRLATDVKGSRGTVRRRLAVAVGGLAALLPLALRAEDLLSPSRLAGVAATSYGAGPQGFGEAALMPATERLFKFERLPPPEAIYMSPSGVAAGYADSDEPVIQLTSLQEAAAAGGGDAAKKEAGGDAKDGEKKEGEGPEKFGRAPESNALQFLRTQDVLLAPGAWQADTGLVYTLFDNDFPVPVFDPITGDMTDVIEGQVRRRLLYTPLAVRYGWSKNVQLFASLPVGYSNTQFSTFGVSDPTNAFGIGDLNAGASVHLIKGEDELPDVITTMDFTAPTGDFDAPIFGLVPGSNLGQGFWAMSASALFIHRYDPVIVFYGGGYRHLFEREFEGLLFSPGEQISYQFGVGFSINDRVTLSAALLGFYITEIQIDNETTPGTNLEPLSLRFAATIARNCRILEPFAMIGMTESAPAFNIGIVVTFY